MYAIVLAGGYAKRLWPLTQHTPKGLLPIAGKPILDYIIEKIDALKPPLSKIVLSTNMLFQSQFQAWLDSRGYSNIELVPDETMSEAQKPGAVKALASIILSSPLDDVLVLAGDGMFNDDLTGMLDAFYRINAPIVATYEVADVEEAKRCAVVALDKDGKILEFTEKPSNPKTMLVGGAVYMFPKSIRKLFNEYLTLDLPMDQPGHFLEWLYQRVPVYGYTLADPLWDIGTPDAYRACNEHFTTAGKCTLEA